MTLTSQAHGDELRIGIRWRSGASELIVTRRPPPLYETKRTPNPAAALIGQLGPSTSDHELVAQLNARRMTTGMGRPFDVAAVKWVRYIRRVPSPSGFEPGELSVDQVAERLGISADVVYYWIERGHLVARRASNGRLCVLFTPDVEAACRKAGCGLASPEPWIPESTCKRGSMKRSWAPRSGAADHPAL